jgi:hypothetical protein
VKTHDLLEVIQDQIKQLETLLGKSLSFEHTMPSQGAFSKFGVSIAIASMSTRESESICWCNCCSSRSVEGIVDFPVPSVLIILLISKHKPNVLSLRLSRGTHPLVECWVLVFLFSSQLTGEFILHWKRRSCQDYASEQMN